MWWNSHVVELGWCLSVLWLTVVTRGGTGLVLVGTLVDSCYTWWNWVGVCLYSVWLTVVTHGGTGLVSVCTQVDSCYSIDALLSLVLATCTGDHERERQVDGQQCSQ